MYADFLVIIIYSVVTNPSIYIIHQRADITHTPAPDKKGSCACAYVFAPHTYVLGVEVPFEGTTDAPPRARARNFVSAMHRRTYDRARVGVEIESQVCDLFE